MDVSEINISVLALPTEKATKQRKARGAKTKATEGFMESRDRDYS